MTKSTDKRDSKVRSELDGNYHTKKVQRPSNTLQIENSKLSNQCSSLNSIPSKDEETIKVKAPATTTSTNEPSISSLFEALNTLWIPRCKRTFQISKLKCRIAIKISVL